MCDWYRKYLSTEEFHPYSENCKECDLMLNQGMTNPSGKKRKQEIDLPKVGGGSAMEDLTQLSVYLDFRFNSPPPPDFHSSFSSESVKFVFIYIIHRLEIFVPF